MTTKFRQCPKCKTSEYQNRSLVMMLNECCHPICKNCMENLFARNVGQCPYENCEKTLKKSGFWIQQFDDPRVERENYIRRRITKIYNLQEDDFETLKEYNDYLERVEDIVFRLANELDVEETEAEIKSFKERYAETIERNKRRATKDDLWIRAMLEEEELRKKKLQDEHTKEELERGQIHTHFNSKAIIDELRSSDLPAEVVLDRQRKKHIEMEMVEKAEAERKKRDKLEEKQRAKERALYGAVRPTGRPYFHIAPKLDMNGPELPTEEEVTQLGFLQHIRPSTKAALAGGFHTFLGCQRALLEAHADLFAFI